MSVILIGLAVAIGLGFAVMVILSSPANPVRFAKAIARQQRLALKTLQRANPGLGKREGWRKAIETRPLFEEHELHQLMDDVAKAARARGAPLKFGDLVAELAILEYSRRVPAAKQAQDKFPEMRAAVWATIPEDI
jgi:hypothetical protein